MLATRASAAICGAFLALIGLAAPALADRTNSSSGEPKLEILLGTIERYGSESEAIAACKPDSVVWADRKTGYFYPRFAKEYGTSSFGTYTCFKGAIKADYWGFGVDTDIGAKKGREFPEFFPCTLCM